VTDEGGGVLGIGIDWAEEFHLVALGRPDQGVIEVVRVEHHPKAVSALVERIAGLEPDPAELRVVIETRHGLLVEALVEAGYTVLPVNPELVSRRRGPARKKDDAEDEPTATTHSAWQPEYAGKAPSTQTRIPERLTEGVSIWTWRAGRRQTG
jgi:Transposase